MGKIDRFLAKPITRKIDGEEFVFRPLNTEDLDLFTGTDTSNQKVMMKKLLNKYLIELFPDSTQEERDTFGFVHAAEFMTAIMEVNGMKDVTKGPTPISKLVPN